MTKKKTRIHKTNPTLKTSPAKRQKARERRWRKTGVKLSTIKWMKERGML